MREARGGGGGRRGRAAVVWVLRSLASQHRWRFVWIPPREQGSRSRGERRRRRRREAGGVMGNTALGFIRNCFGLSLTAQPFVIDLIINVETLVNKNLDPGDSFVFE